MSETLGSVILAIFALIEVAPTSPPKISSSELYARLQAGEKIVILDVREENEYLSRHIPDAIWFPKSRFDRGDAEVLKKLEKIDKKTLLVTYCGAGHRSNYVAKRLRAMGYNAYNLDGISFWEKEGYPLIRGPKLPPTEEPAIIFLEEAYENYYLLFKDVVWIDVRNEEDYNRGHVQGALSIPLSDIEARLNEIPRDKEIVLYCEGTWEGGSCEASRSAGRILIKNGFSQGKIKVFENGFGAWKNAGYPVESTAAKITPQQRKLLKYPPAQRPEIVVEPEVYDFGKLSIRQAVAERPLSITEIGKLSTRGIEEATFIVKNKGKVPLVIDNIKTSCGCTLASLKVRGGKRSSAFSIKGKTDKTWSAEILPGQEAELTVVFDPLFHIPKTFPHQVTRTVTISSNDLLQPRKVIRIKAKLVE